MAFILPDNILETLLCSFCHKYLSVKPTKVYPNRLIQCGRCVDKKEQAIHNFEAVESQYGKIAENILFKCVNRFDGCRELLTYSQVKDHEQVCLEKIHECPICVEEMASFLILRHFHSNHKDAILDCPAFVFKLNDLLQMPSVYIYQEEDNLFFLYISYTKSENTIKLYLVYIGSYKLAKNIYHQFTVSSENKEFDVVLIPRPCTDDFFVVDISHMSNLIQIKFKLIDRNLKVLTAPEISNAVRKPIVKNAPLRLEFNLNCYYCKAFCILSLSTCPVNYYYIDNDGDYICCYCYKFYKFESDKPIVEKVIPISSLETIKFFKLNCINCCSEIEFSDVQSHEINCKLGRQYTCPIENCCEKGTANQMIEHLKDRHKEMSFGSQFILPINFLRGYAFVKEYIALLSVTDTGNFSSLEHKYIDLELVPKIDSDAIFPYVSFFNARNEILSDYSTFASYSEVFVKVFVQKK
ncbi:uncharacterized protein LOC114332060 isoform X2 [Diabrotica virgifera virgifera]|uniref:Uncharacterized protein LOC114332060 isoform X2 n=1 Tax=Diabrotica virgifera virgifera TaxID=50390 RepID=A0A6P7FXH3_DIAVI|nr:uncharacterized protein LOC114332060 isoform X2 [Diabrotica virgifera virgifera]